MRRLLWLAAMTAVFIFPASGRCQQQGQGQQGQGQGQSQPTGQSSTQAAQTPTPQQESLAEAARRAREQKKEAPKAGKVFTNDNMPTQGGVYTVGEASTTPSGEKATKAAGAAPASNDEKAWRERFAKLHHQLERDQAELEVMQRELSVLNLQFYNDPTQAMQQQLTRSDINDKTSKIEAKKKQVEADKQAIADAEDELRKSGGDSGWAR